MPYNCYFEESTTCHHSIGLDPLKKWDVIQNKFHFDIDEMKLFFKYKSWHTCQFISIPNNSHHYNL